MGGVVSGFVDARLMLRVASGFWGVPHSLPAAGHLPGPGLAWPPGRADGWAGADGVGHARTAVVEPAAVPGWLLPSSSQPRRFTMASPPETGRRRAPGRTQDTVRRAKLHLSAASDMLDCAATAITRAAELAGERDGAGDELAGDIAALRSSARMLVDLLSE